MLILSIHLCPLDQAVFKMDDPVGRMGYIVFVGNDQDRDSGLVYLL